MAHGFVYLAAVIDWFSRRVLAWRLSITMDTSFCIEALDEALSQYGRPEMFNTDQGSQFTSEDFTGGSKKRASRSAWTARAAGATTCSSSASGARSNTSKSTCTPTSRWAKPEARSRATSSSTTPTPALQPGGTDARPGIFPPSARSSGGLTRNKTGRGNAGHMERTENDRTVFRPSHKTLKIDETDFTFPPHDDD